MIIDEQPIRLAENALDRGPYVRVADSQAWHLACGKLYLSTPHSDTAAALVAAIRQAGRSVDEPLPGLFSLAVTAEQLQQLARGWTDSLSPHDLGKVQCLLTNSVTEPLPSEFMWAEPLSCLVDRINCHWLEDVISAARLVTHFQPIVYIDAPGVIYGYECLLRGEEADGQLISPYRLYSAARRTNLLNCLDAAARLTAINSATHLQLDSTVFINLNPRSLEGPGASLAETLRAVASSHIAAADFVFEVVESDELSDSAALLEIADQIRDAGCRVALDDVGAGYNSLNLIACLKPDFIKLDMDLIRGVHTEPYKARVTAKLLELARELEVRTVAEGVEEAGEWQWVLEHGADFAQGYLFARPAPQPPQSEFSGGGTRSLAQLGCTSVIASAAPCPETTDL